MFDIVGVGVLVAAALLFGWLTTRAWKIRRGALRWLATIPAALVALLAALLTVGALVGYSRLNASRPNPVREVSVAMTPENIARGEQFAQTCAGCHASNGQLPLTGQPNFFGGAPFGTFNAPNLTQAHLADWSDGEIIRAIREGVAQDGRSLLIMPSEAFHTMSDEDVQALVAYLRSQGDVGPDTPQNNLNVLGALIFGLNPPFSAQPPVAGDVTAPPAGMTPEYGAYLVSTIGCRECHGANLGGGVAAPNGNGPPAGPSLLGIPGAWSEEDFLTLMRTGMRPDGSSVSQEMPYQDYEKFGDEEILAIYAHLEAARP